MAEIFQTQVEKIKQVIMLPFVFLEFCGEESGGPLLQDKVEISALASLQEEFQ